MYPQNNCLFFYQTCIFHHGCRKFSNLLCSDYLKVHFQFKQIESRYLIMFPYAKVSSQVHTVTAQAEKKFPLPSEETFFRKSVSPSRKGGEGNHDVP